MKKRLYRKKDEAMVAGVCAGFADYVGFDPAIWRLATVFLTLVTGGGFALVYLVAWIIIPEEPAATYKVVE